MSGACHCRAAEYRARAAEYRTKADLAQTRERAAELKELAYAYLRLAEQAERNSKADLVYEPPAPKLSPE
jgi:hypothetical protein